MAIITVIMAIRVPVLTSVRRSARQIWGMRNQWEIVSAVNSFASDNNDGYPESVATIGTGDHWNWQQPTMLTSYRSRGPRVNRSMSAYLGSYIREAGIMVCPNAPRRYKYLQQAWDAGDDWDNPDTPAAQDPVIGTYCFYWNYTGFLQERGTVFRGPRNSSGGTGESKLLVSDYLGYNHWRSPNSYSSCEKFKGVSITHGTPVSSAYWSGRKAETEAAPDRPTLKLRAGYIDGHVGSFNAAEAIPMKASITADGTVPYPEELGPGVFYLPKNALGQNY